MGNYVSPWRTEELDLFRATVRTFLKREATPHLRRWAEQHVVDRELWTKAGAAGLRCCSIPEAYGGGGGSFAADLVVLEEQARICDTGWGNHVHSGIVAHYLLAYGTEEQKRRWLPRMATGELIGAIAMTEPGTGSDLKAVTTRAVRDGDEYVISGAKTFITNGSSANLVIVVAKTDPAAGARGMSLIVVETDGCPGFRRGRVLDKIGQPAADTSELFLDEAHVPVANLLGTEGGGFDQLMSQLPQERLLIGVIAIAAAECAVEETLAYVKEREAFGGPLMALQNTRFELAECATLACWAGLRRLVHRTAPAWRAGHRDRLDGQVVAHRSAMPDRRPLPTVVRWLRLHERVSDRPPVRRRARTEDLRRRERGDEGTDRPARSSLPLPGGHQSTAPARGPGARFSPAECHVHDRLGQSGVWGEERGDRVAFAAHDDASPHSWGSPHDPGTASRTRTPTTPVPPSGFRCSQPLTTDAAAFQAIRALNLSKLTSEF